jgi:hypothetical protein
MQRRLDEMGAELRAALDGLKVELAALQESPTAEAAPAERSAEPEAVDETIAEAEAAAARAPDVKDASGPPPQEEALRAPEEEASGPPEGARVLALKMALDGRPREETARYLAENFALDDPDALLDEVYAKAGG